MKNLIRTIVTTGALAGSLALSAQEPDRPRATPQGQADRQEPGSVTYARVKELSAGKKVVLDVDNAVDKSFDLADKDINVQLPKDLKVGDPVKVTEQNMNGKKTVNIALDTNNPGVKHGDDPTK